MRLCVCTCVCTCVCALMCVHLCVCAYVSLCVHFCVYACMYVLLGIHLCVCLCVCVHVCVHCVCVSVYTVWCWELNSASLQEQYMLITPESPLHLLIILTYKELKKHNPEPNLSLWIQRNWKPNHWSGKYRALLGMWSLRLQPHLSSSLCLTHPPSLPNVKYTRN